MSFILTRKSDYALLALARLSQACGSVPGPGSGPGPVPGGVGAESVSARMIADEFHLPLPLLTNILKDLSNAGLIASRRGAGGGYYLNRSPAQITLAQVVAAIEGPVALARCCDSQTKSDDACPACNLTSRCPITHTMHRFNDAIALAMHQLTLAQMMQENLRIALNIHCAPGNENSVTPLSGSNSLSLAQTA